MISISLNIKRALKHTVNKLLGNNYIASWRIYRTRQLKRLTILNLHRVGNYDQSTYPPLSIDNFRLLIDFLKNSYTIVCFKKLEELQNSEKPFLILSFDDGYFDFYEKACPILEDNNIIANQNIVPWCVDNQRPPLNVALQDFIGKDQQYSKRSISLVLTFVEISNWMDYQYLSS